MLEGPGAGGLRNKAGWGEYIALEKPIHECRVNIQAKPPNSLLEWLLKAQTWWYLPWEVISEDQRVFPFFPLIISWWIKTLTPRGHFLGKEVLTAFSLRRGQRDIFRRQWRTECLQGSCWGWWLLDPAQLLSIPCSLSLWELWWAVPGAGGHHRHRHPKYLHGDISMHLHGVQGTTAKD